jgi:hypothetical protein
MSVASSTAGAAEKVALGRIPLAGLLGAALAIVGNLILFYIASGLLGLQMALPMPPDNALMPLPAIAVIMSTLMGAIGGSILLAILGRFAPRPITIFLAISVIFTLISFGGPLSLPVETSTMVVLSIMHIIAAVAIVWALVTRTRA